MILTGQESRYISLNANGTKYIVVTLSAEFTLKRIEKLRSISLVFLVLVDWLVGCKLLDRILGVKKKEKIEHDTRDGSEKWMEECSLRGDGEGRIRVFFHRHRSDMSNGKRETGNGKREKMRCSAEKANKPCGALQSHVHGIGMRERYGRMGMQMNRDADNDGSTITPGLGR